MQYEPMRFVTSYCILVIQVLFQPVMAAGDPIAGEQKALLCVTCHGASGRSTVPNIPKLSGQMENYIVRATEEFQSGIRTSPVMSDISAMLKNPVDLEDIAAYFASQPIMTGTPRDSALAQRGEALFTSGRCNYCHGEGGKRFAPFKMAVPVIGGQHKTYLIIAMRDIRDAIRPGDDYDLMKQTLEEMTEQDIEAIAEYLSGL